MASMSGAGVVFHSVMMFSPAVRLVQDRAVLCGVLQLGPTGRSSSASSPSLHL